jgi:hypothetical protein
MEYVTEIGRVRPAAVVFGSLKMSTKFAKS